MRPYNLELLMIETYPYLDINMYIITIPPHQGAVYQPLAEEMMDFIMVVVEAVITIPHQ